MPAFTVTVGPPEKYMLKGQPPPHDGAFVRVVTDLGIGAHAYRASTLLAWKMTLPDDSEGHLPASYVTEDVEQYLKTVIKNSIVRMLAAIKEEVPDAREEEPAVQ